MNRSETANNERSGLTIWDLLVILLILLLLGVGLYYVLIFANPYSALNPFPPPTLPAAIVIPSDTPTARAMPSTWTPTPIGGSSAEKPAAAGSPTATGMLTATGFTLPTWTGSPTVTGSATSTPTRTNTPTRTKTPFPPAMKTATAIGNIWAKYTQQSLNKTLTAMPTRTPTAMANPKAATAKGSIKSNVWQKTTNNPTFTWPITSMMYEFYWYFGRNPDGTEMTQREPIRHDSKYVEFTPPPVTECGTYYLRIMTRYAIKTKTTIEYADSNWSTIFIFKYDPTPPLAPLYASTGITGALRGIQNKSGTPSFSWSGVNGANAANEILPEGDYIGYDLNEDGIKEPYQCSGIKGYNVSFGADPNDGVLTKYVTTPGYKPGTLSANRAYYLRVQSIDKMDNKSEWRLVALDETYDPEAVGFAEPTIEQAVFFYDNVRPNNIDGITELNGYNSGDPFTNFRTPNFTWTGGEDPTGYNTAVIWGYDVKWSTNLDASPIFQKTNTYDPLLSTSGTYYLRVRAVDWAGNTSRDWVDFIFRFDNVGPASVKTVTEANAVKSNTYYKSLVDPVLHFSWDAAKLVDPGTTSTRSGIQDTMFIYWGNDPEGIPGIAQNIAVNTFDAPVGGTDVYFLRFLTRDNAGNETVTTPFVLKFDQDAPNAPVITELHGVISNTDQPTFKDPNFSFTADDVGSGLKSYHYCWAQDAPCTPNKSVSTGAYNPAAVGTGTIWFLEVYAVDNAGNVGPTSEFIFRYTP